MQKHEINYEGQIEAVAKLAQVAAGQLIIDAAYRQGKKEVIEWLEHYAIHGGKTPLSIALADMEAHSPFKKDFRKEHGLCQS